MMEDIDFEINNASGDENGQENNDNEQSSSSNTKDDSRVVIKRTIRNPQPKLNPERLCGDRGLIQLPKIFSEVVTKGKGNEKEYLDTVLKVLEHWSYRLFPRFTFDDVLEKIEHLGAKRPVQTCLKKIRLDMLMPDDTVQDDNEAQRTCDGDPSDTHNVDPQIQDSLFDQVLGPPPVLSPDQHNSDLDITPTVDEQAERMRRNRILALERRAAKLQQSVVCPPQENSSSDGASETVVVMHCESELDNTAVPQSRHNEDNDEAMLSEEGKLEFLAEDV